MGIALRLAEAGYDIFFTYLFKEEHAKRVKSKSKQWAENVSCIKRILEKRMWLRRLLRRQHRHGEGLIWS